MNFERMEAQLVLHEGLRTKAYLDTEGNWTIGVGYNIDGRGWDALEQAIGRSVRPADGKIENVCITRDESLVVLRVDIGRFDAAVRAYFPEYARLDDVRQRVVLDMVFNMGFRALGFKKAIDAIRKKDWSRAARELYNSKWSRQVGDGEGGRWDRCDRLSQMLLTGQDYVR